MRRILDISLLLLTMAAASSCLYEDRENFDESASQRVRSLVERTEATLASHPEGWVMQYFGDAGRGGYNYVFRFDGQKAQVSCETASSDYVEECLWEIIREDGAVLTFDTYSALIQQFHEPSFGNVEGYGGDYEFRIVGIDENDVISLSGKIHRGSMRMFPLPEGYTPQSWLDAVKDMEGRWGGDFNVYSSDYERLASTMGFHGGRTLCFTEGLYPSVTTYDYKKSIIWTPDGFRFQDVLSLGGYHGQDFIWDGESFSAADGNLRFTDNGVSLPSYDDIAGKWYLHYFNYFSSYYNLEVELVPAGDGRTFRIDGVFKVEDLDNLKVVYDNGRLYIYPQQLGMYSGYYVWALPFDSAMSTVLWDAETCLRGNYQKENGREYYQFADCGTASGDYSTDSIILYEFVTEEPSVSTRVTNLDVLCEMYLYR